MQFPAQHRLPRRDAYRALAVCVAGTALALLLAPRPGSSSASEPASEPAATGSGRLTPNPLGNGNGASGVPMLPWPRLPRPDNDRADSAPVSHGAGAAVASDEIPRVSPNGIEAALAYTITLEGDGIYGTGFLIDPERGYAITAWHVVSDMKAPRATFYDGRVAPARLVASDKKLDIALLELPRQNLPPPELGDVTELRPGDEVFAVGAPRKLGFTVSRGIVSFVGRTMEGARYLQADMSINDGNSGGPIIDARGRIVGVISFIYRRAQGLSFALPINYVVDRWADRLEPGNPVDRQRRAVYLTRFAQWQQLTTPGPLRTVGTSGSD